MSMDISTLIQKYGLTPEQAQEVEKSYAALSPEQREDFTVEDFEKLLAAQGLTVYHLMGDPDKPTLTPPKTSDITSALFLIDGMASPGALIMSLITKDAAEQRRQAQETTWAISDLTVASLNDQADEIRSKAVKQLITGVISGAATIAGGAVSSFGGISTAKGLRAGTLTDQQAMAANTAYSGYTKSIDGAGQISGAVGSYLGTQTDAEIKEMEGDIEKLRTQIDISKKFDEQLMDLIKKSISAAEAIAQNTNQTRAKILG
ncbi:MAG: type III secretion system translocon subunit SctB [Deltaproteobacteria bacterium]|jgi:hypothetical protein|nr:type III secretion system translocon subunit SctB [Deltaproteobacteria bacterium]